MRINKLIALAASAAAGGTLMFASPSAAAAAPAAAGGQALAACRIAAGPEYLSGRTVRLWFCDGTGGTANGYHGQVLSGRAGDQLYLRSATGTITALVNVPATGDYNTRTVGDHGGPWRACVHIPNEGQICTVAAW
ncbi:hypothetical protein Sme01_31760 [Sphaerisporangium melleum]|uniref:Secreted protein n=1 Tax=Sphaerisporangium melleum TaxID=321316 RepID=A0A917VLH3_9ACTN|nr:hypothetical protein [Sphaerisporangium melleum]GGK96275.1 hypothetical protein GCM10007964_43180 [Sphaerisporangium melleum]GII70700.1 hypothetical protein Sme01_31760 [Sphaerisporangium melleum]